MADVLTRDRFTAWVQGKDEADVIGRAGRADSCPLATYLHEHGYPLAVVRDDYYCLDRVREFRHSIRPEDGPEPAEHYPLEDWMRDVVRAVDALWAEVRAGQVVAFLDRLDD